MPFAFLLPSGMTLQNICTASRIYLRNNTIAIKLHISLSRLRSISFYFRKCHHYIKLICIYKYYYSQQQIIIIYMVNVKKRKEKKEVNQVGFPRIQFDPPSFTPRLNSFEYFCNLMLILPIDVSCAQTATQPFNCKTFNCASLG